ncbi:hypothetical protein [Sphingomonas sp. MMS24-J13]|uniref:hypothetical protein n=1 Tax=Sphingomonas sp. MMS24-J13 TaxID=3238686 RepID=UPI00384C22E2
MAFLDLEVGAPAALSRGHLRGHTLPRLGAQERRAVLLARSDPPSSLHRGLGSRLLSLLFGIETPRMLADGRLEALRRYALLYRIHGKALPEIESERARDAGYSDGELARARALIDVAHAIRRPRRSGAHILAITFGLVMTALLAFAAVTEIAPKVDSPLIAALLVGLAIVSLAPIAGRNGSSGRAYR